MIQSVAVGWEIYALTGDVLDLGWVGLAQFAPLAALSLPAGGIADRHDRRRIVVICRLGYAVGALALAACSAWLHEDGRVFFFSTLVALGAVRAFLAPAESALLPSLVTKERLPRAIALSSTTFQVGMIAGPALGGLLYAVGGAITPYLTAAGLELVAALAMGTVPYRPRPPAPQRQGAWAHLLSGLRFVMSERLLLGAISLDLVAVLLGGSVALLPVMATEVLGVGEVEFGLLRSAPAVGAAVVAAGLATVPLRRHAGAAMLICVALFGIATITFGLSRNLWLSLAALTVTGGADMVSVVVRQSLIQLRTPDDYRGRVASVNMIFIGGSNELGELESGVTAAWLGTVHAVVAGGIGTLLVTGIWARCFPELRRVDRLSELSERPS